MNAVKQKWQSEYKIFVRRADDDQRVQFNNQYTNCFHMHGYNKLLQINESYLIVSTLTYLCSPLIFVCLMNNINNFVLTFDLCKSNEQHQYLCFTTSDLYTSTKIRGQNKDIYPVH